MTSIRLLAALAITAFVSTAIVLVPARLMHTQVFEPRGLEAASVTGTVWDGHWHHAVWRGRPVGDVSIRLSLLSLVSGEPEILAAVSASGLSLEARVRFAGQRLRIREGEGSIVPGRYVRIGGQLASLADETVRISGLNGEFDEAGCVALSGNISGDVLSGMRERLNVALPALGGGVQCAGRAVGITFEGNSDELRVSGNVRLTPDYAGWRIEAVPGDDSLMPALAALGFGEADGTWSLEGQDSWQALQP